MSVLSKISKSLDLSLIGKKTFKPNELEFVTNFIRSYNFYQPETSGYDALLQPFLAEVERFLTMSGLDYALFGANWASTIFSLCVHTATAVLTDSTLLRGLSIAAITTLLIKIVLEVYVTAQNKQRRAPENITVAVKKHALDFTKTLLDFGLPAYVPVPGEDPEVFLAKTLKDLKGDVIPPKNFKFDSKGRIIGEQTYGSATYMPAPYNLTEEQRDALRVQADSDIASCLTNKSSPALRTMALSPLFPDMTADYEEVKKANHAKYTAPAPAASVSTTSVVPPITTLSASAMPSTTGLVVNVTPTVTPMSTVTSASATVSTPTGAVKKTTSTPKIKTKTPLQPTEQGTTEAVNWIKVVKKSLAFCVVAGGILVTKGDITSMNYWITLDKFRGVVEKQFGDAEAVVDWFCNDVMGLNLYAEKEMIEILEKRIHDCDDLLKLPSNDYGPQPSKYLELQKLQKGNVRLIATIGSINDIAIRNLTDMLKKKDVLLLNKIEEVYAVMKGMTIRQVPVPLMIYGPPGAGKTTFVQEVLIPRLAARLGLQAHNYTVKFTDADKYWPEYSLQDFATFDESFDKAKDIQDQMVSSMNSVLSSLPYNMQGAFIKYQMCEFKFVFIMTNHDDCPNLGKMLNPTACGAFWNRLQNPVRLTVKPSHQSKTGLRASHDFKEDWSHIELTTTPFNFSAAAGQFTYDPQAETPLTLDKLLTRLTEAYYSARTEYVRTATAQGIAIPQSADTSNFVVNIAGATGVGKTYAARYISDTIAQFLKRPVVSVENSYPRKELPTQAVTICNDVLPANEEDYSKIYNERQGQLIFNTHNFPYKTRSWLFQARQYCQGDSPVGYVVPTGHPGVARRLGVPGYLSTPFGEVVVPETDSLYLTMNTRGFLTNQLDGKSYDLTGALELVWSRYVAYLSQHKEIKYIEGNIPLSEPDIYIYFKDIATMSKTLSSYSKAFAATAMPGPNARIIIRDYDTVFAGKVFNPHLFVIPKTEKMLPEDVTKTLIANLRHCGINCTVKVDIGTDTYFADGFVIIHNTVTAENSVIVDENSVRICEDGVLVTTLPLSVVVTGLESGFSSMPSHILKLLLSHRDMILNQDSARLMHAKIRKSQLEAQAILEAAKNKTLYTAAMKNHPMFPFACAGIALLSTAAIGGIAALITRAFWKPEPPKLDETIIGIKESWDLEAQAKYDEHAKRANLRPEEATAIRNARQSFGRPGNAAIGETELAAIRAFMNQPTDTGTIEAVHTMLPVKGSSPTFNRLARNIVMVSGSSNEGLMTVHGLAIMDRFIVTVFHVGTQSLTVVCDEGDKTVTYAAESVSALPGRDLQLIEIVDKKCPAFPNITRSFSQHDVPTSEYYHLLVASTPFYVVPCILSPVPVQKGVWEFNPGGYGADYHTSQGPVTQNGFCGLPYYKEGEIFGIHTGSVRTRNLGLLTRISQGILNSLFTADKEAGEPDDSMPDIPVRLFKYADRTVTVFDMPCAYRQLWDINKITPNAFKHTENLHYIAKVPYNEPYPRKPRFITTGIKDIPGIPNNMVNAPMQFAGAETDLSGRPSVALNQIIKFGGPTFELDDTIAEWTSRAMRSYLDDLYLSEIDTPHVPHVSWREAFNGFPHGHPLAPYLEGLRLSTGAGFYWKHVWKISTKRSFFNSFASTDYGQEIALKKDEASLALSTNLNLAWFALMSGTRPLLINTDQMKGELLTKEKAAIGKTRLFSVADIVEVLLERRLFAQHLALMVKTRMKGPFKLGTSPLKDWNEIYQQMVQGSRMVVEADFASYDKCLPFDLVRRIMRMLLGTDDVADAVAEMVCFGFHHCADFIYMRRKGQNSGSALTAWLNSLCTGYLLAYADAKISFTRTGRFPKRIIFRRARCLIYSDDLTFQDNGAIDVEEFIHEMRRLGLVLKVERADITQTKFLSRYFNVINGVCLPALKIDSFSRHLYWTKTMDTIHLADMYSLVLDEAALHGPKVYDLFSAAIYSILESTRDPLCLCLMDWRPYRLRAEKQRMTAIGGADFTRSPLSDRNLFKGFPDLQTFNKSVEDRYMRAATVSQMEHKVEIQHSHEPITLAQHSLSKLIKQSGRSTNNMDNKPNDSGPSPTVTSTLRPTLPIAAAAASTASDGASGLQTTPLPPVAITEATEDLAPTVVDNSNVAPNLLSAGGIVNNLITSAYQTWYLVGSYTVASDAARNSVIFKIPYGKLEGPAKIWKDLHTRYTGGFEYAVESVGSAALIGTSTVGWHPDIDEVVDVTDLMHYPYWINMPMNETKVAHYTIGDVRKTNFYNNPSDSKSHGVVMLINVPLSNPFGTSGVTVTYNVYCRLGADFVATAWQEPPAPTRSITGFRNISLATLGLGDQWILIDGCEDNRAFDGIIPYPAAGSDFRTGTDAHRDPLYLYQMEPYFIAQGSSGVPHTNYYSPGTGPSPAPLNVSHHSSATILTNSVSTATFDEIEYDADHNETHEFVNFTIQWTSSTVYWASLVVSLDLDGHASTAASLPLKGETFSLMNLPYSVAAWTQEVGEYLPSDWVRIVFAESTTPLEGALVDTASGRASAPPTNRMAEFYRFLSKQSENTIEFDILSSYGGEAAVTCRYIRRKGIFARFANINRLQAYYFLGSRAGNYSIGNLREVTDDTIFRQSSLNSFFPRYSSLALASSLPKLVKEGLFGERQCKRIKDDVAAQLVKTNYDHNYSYMEPAAVEQHTKRKVIDCFPINSLTVTQNRDRAPICQYENRGDHDVVYYHYPNRPKFAVARVALNKEATAALIAMSMAGSALSAGAQAGGGIMTRKKDRQFAKDMMEDQQGFTKEMAQMGMDYQDKAWNRQAIFTTAGTAANYKHQENMWDNAVAQQNAMFAKNAELQKQMWQANAGLQVFSGAASMHHQNNMQARNFAQASQMQADSFANQAAMQQSSFQHDNQMAAMRRNTVKVAFGVTNPGANVGGNPQPTSGTYSQSWSSPPASSPTGYAPASHSTPGY